MESVQIDTSVKVIKQFKGDVSLTGDLLQLDLNYEEESPQLDDLYKRIDFSRPPQNCSAEDMIIWRILRSGCPFELPPLEKKGDDDEDNDDDLEGDYIPPHMFSSQYSRYEKSLRRFGIGAEQFFSILRATNAAKENVTQNNEKQILDLNDKQQDTNPYLIQAPLEIKLLILQFSGPKTFYNLLQSNKQWYQILNPSQSVLIKKAVASTLRVLSLGMWPKDLIKATPKYLKQFENWREMIKHRPKIRFDGIYVCKYKFFKDGDYEWSEYRPIHEVVYYRYLRFLRDGRAMFIYTSKTPKKFIEKQLTVFSEKKQVEVNYLNHAKQKVEKSTAQLGIWKMVNDTVQMSHFDGGSEYRYEFQALRWHIVPESQRNYWNRETEKPEHLLQTWQGFRWIGNDIDKDVFNSDFLSQINIDQDKDQYRKYKVETLIEQRHTFIPIDSF